MIFAFLILVTSATTCGNVLFFQANERFSTENAKFWPILAILSQIYAHFGVFFAGLNNMVTYQKWQTPGIDICILKGKQRLGP